MSANTFADGHTVSNAPDLFRPPKLSGTGPGQYWGGGPPGKPLGSCQLFILPCCSSAVHSLDWVRPPGIAVYAQDARNAQDAEHSQDAEDARDTENAQVAAVSCPRLAAALCVCACVCVSVCVPLPSASCLWWPLPHSFSLTAIPCRMHRISFDLRS